MHWTGEAGDGKWSTPGNWQEQVDPSKVSDSEHRILVFPGGSVSSNDYAKGFALKQVQFTGAGKSVLTGSKITINASCLGISATDSDVVISNDVHNAWGLGVSSAYGELVFAGLVSSSRGAYFSVSDAGNYMISSSEAHIRFLGGLKFTGSQRNYALNYELGAPLDFGRSQLQHLESALDVAECNFGRNSWTIRLQIDAPGSCWTTARIRNGIVYAGAPNVFARTGVIEPNNASSNTAWWDLNGFDQTIDRIAGTYKGTDFKSVQPATLTQEATGDGNFGGDFGGALSLVWAPTGAFTFNASGVNGTTGDITVSNGTFLVSGSGSFAAVRNVTVSEGATLSVESSAAGSFAGLLRADVAGTLVVSATANAPFGPAQVILGANGKIAVPAGVTLTLAAVKLGGTYLADAEYAGEAWIDGEGTVRVSAAHALESGFVWKEAASGNWGEGSNWIGATAPDNTKPVTVAASGEDYTVTVPDATSLSRPLTVGGQATGIGTVTFAGAATLADGATVAVNRNGRIAVGADQTLTLAPKTGATKADEVVTITEGGRLDQTGGTIQTTGFNGTLLVKNGGTMNVSGGTIDFEPSLKDGHLQVAEGGTLTFSGTGKLGLHSPGWAKSPLSVLGGTVTFAGTSVLEVYGVPDHTYEIPGYGTLRLTGNATVQVGGNGATTVGVFPTTLADGTFSLEVTENAAFNAKSCTLLFGNCHYSVPNNMRTVLTLDSGAENFLGNHLLVGVNGRNGAKASFIVKRGTVTVGADGFKLGVVSGPEDTVTSPYADALVSGGVLKINGANCDQGESYFSGFTLASSLPESDKTSSTAVYTAPFTLEDGIVSNLHGRIVIGIGKSLGAMRQKGGAFVSGSRAAAFIGAYDGEGRWEMTGGTATLNETIYLGIGDTIQTMLGQYAKCNLGTHVVGTAAKGVLDIAAGSFMTAGDIISGTDGNSGTISVGPAGVLKAKSLRMLNAADDTLTVRVGPNGAGKIELSDALDLAAGITLKIEGAETYAGEAAKFDLLTCKTSTRPLSEIEIEGVIPAPMRLVRTATRIRLLTEPKGLTVIIR